MKIMKIINFIRLKKELYYPCELVGMQGKTVTEAYENINAKSQLRWDHFNPITEQITPQQQKVQKIFLRWLITKRVVTNYKVKPSTWKWRITTDKAYVRIENETDDIEWYKKEDAVQKNT